MAFSSPPPDVPNVIVSFPVPHVLLVTLNRPSQLNALPRQMHFTLANLWHWYDAEPSLRCAVVTGAGRAFCAGADLKQWNETNHAVEDTGKKWAEDGFGGLSNRRGKKPVIAAVNGLCLGGGFEMAINVDLIVASETAKFGLPEVKRGVVAIAGALPRLIRTVGRQRASEMALLGRMYTAQEALAWGIVNTLVPVQAKNKAKPSPQEQEQINADVVKEALSWASELSDNSPDSIIVSRAGLMGGWDAQDPQESTKSVDRGIYRGLDGGENMKEGVLSFVEKRKAVWKNSKL